MKPGRLILAGGSGFLGQALARHFLALGWEVLVLTRWPRAHAAAPELRWDGATLDDWARELDGATALVNLSGRTVDCRYTARNRREIMESRVKPTRVLGEAVAGCAQPPRVWLNASSATIYRHTRGPAWDESGKDFAATPEVKDEFSLEVIHAWEWAFFREDSGAGVPPAGAGVSSAEQFPDVLHGRDAGGGRRDACPTMDRLEACPTRKVALRTTMVLGHARNSVFPVLCRLARLGLGGPMGSGQQFVSWLHETDFCRAVEFVIAREDFSGPVNLAAPNPLPNAEMMRAFRELVGVPFGLPATEWMLELGAFFLRTETELILKSRRVVPGRLLAAGFEFRFAHFHDALADLAAAGR